MSCNIGNMTTLDHDVSSIGFGTRSNNLEVMVGRNAVVSVLILNHFRKRSIRLPLAFRHMQNVCDMGDEWIISVDGNSEYRVVYDRINGRLEHTNVLMKDLDIKWFNPIILTCESMNRYKINVFSPSGLEVTNLKTCKMHGRVGYQYTYGLLSADCQNRVLSFEEKLCINNRAIALSRFSMVTDGQKPIYINICSSHICEEVLNLDVGLDVSEQFKNKAHCGYVKILMGQMEFNVQLTYAAGILTLQSGWSKFVKLAGLSPGEILVIKFMTESMNIQACVLSIWEIDLINKDQGIVEDVSFLTMINQTGLREGIIAVPSVVCLKLGSKIDRKLSCALPSGSVIYVYFQSQTNLISGFKDFFALFNVEVDDVMVLKINLTAVSELQLYRKNGLCLSYERRHNSLQDSNRCTNLFNCRQPICTADIVQEPESINVDSDRENLIPKASTLQATEGVFEIILKPSHVDGRTHGAYVSKDLAQIYRRWKDRSSAIVCDCNSTWKVLMHIDKNRCRFGKGWNEVVTGAKLKVGQKIRFCLVNPKKKLFSIAVLP